MNRPAACVLAAIALLFARGPALGAVSAEKVERLDTRKVAVTWSAKSAVDVYVSDRPDASLAQAKLVSAADRDGRFESPAPRRSYFLLKDRSDGAVARVAERVLPLEQGSNFRDLGGYPAAGGKHIRWGRIFRSGATPLLTDADLAQVKALDLKDMIDLRSSEERSLAPTRIQGVRYEAVGYPMSSIMGQGAAAQGGLSQLGGLYAQFPEMLAPQLRILFQALLSGDGGAIAYNCSAGQDRTGFATAMVLSALGARREVIIADYHLSTIHRRPEWEMPRFEPAVAAANPTAAYFAHHQGGAQPRKPQPLFDAQGRALLQYAFDAIEQRWGSVEAYLDKEIGVDAADIARLRQMYLE
jgi:protein-tyrosine phosphatase